MNNLKKVTYTAIFIGIAVITFWAISYHKESQSENIETNQIEMIVYKNEACICCDRWVEYLEKHGYQISTEITHEMITIKKSNNVPSNMASCHTAIVDGYVVEGHVPVEDITRLLKERPDAVGISAPGMPASSPGMDVSSEPYDTYLLNSDGSNIHFVRHE